MVLGERKATAKLGMGMTEIGAGVAIARLFADTSIVKERPALLGLVLLVARRHHSTS